MSTRRKLRRSRRKLRRSRRKLRRSLRRSRRRGRRRTHKIGSEDEDEFYDAVESPEEEEFYDVPEYSEQEKRKEREAKRERERVERERKRVERVKKKRERGFREHFNYPQSKESEEIEKELMEKTSNELRKMHKQKRYAENRQGIRPYYDDSGRHLSFWDPIEEILKNRKEEIEKELIQKIKDGKIDEVRDLLYDYDQENETGLIYDLEGVWSFPYPIIPYHYDNFNPSSEASWTLDALVYRSTTNKSKYDTFEIRDGVEKMRKEKREREREIREREIERERERLKERERKRVEEREREEREREMEREERKRKRNKRKRNRKREREAKREREK
jgi:hypothetical protein